MTVKASGRLALILATGFLVCFAAGPSQAAASAANAKSETAEGAPVALNKNAKPGSRHGKSYAHRKSSKVAEKSAADKKATDAADDGVSAAAASIPPSVANANAELASAAAETPTGSAARAMSARASEILQNPPADAAARPAETMVVAADQLNDVDRVLHETPPSASPLTMASADVPASPPAAPVMAAGSGESSTWDETSLIGKIFIGFGALLTMASAARMFMA